LTTEEEDEKEDEDEEEDDEEEGIVNEWVCKGWVGGNDGCFLQRGKDDW